VFQSRADATTRHDAARLTTPGLLYVAIAGGFALALGLVQLGAPSFWVDESFTAKAVRGPYLDTVEGYHWLYYSIVKPWAFVAGTSEWALRFPSVLGAAAACVLLVLLAAKVFDTRVAAVSGVLLAVNPLVVQWSQQARGYTFLLALSLLAMLLLVRALEEDSRDAWAVYGLAFAAVIVWHPVAGLLLVPAHAVLALQKRERLLPHGLLALVLICALGIPWAAQIAMRSTGDGVAMDWLEAPGAGEAVATLFGVSGAVGLGLALALVGLALLWRDGERDRMWWLATWAFTPFVVALVVSVVRPIYLDRYLLVAAPAFALLGGVALVRLTHRWRWPVATAVCVGAVVGLGAWYATGWNGNWRGEDWRGAVSTVLERKAAGEPVLVTEWPASPAAVYYGADVVDVSTASSLWVITWSESGDEPTEEARRSLGYGDHRRVDRIEFGRRVAAEHWQR
jgi:mannosyltransferase